MNDVKKTSTQLLEELAEARQRIGELEASAAELEQVRDAMSAAEREGQGLLRQVIDAFPGFVFVKDREGRFVVANQALADVYNMTVEELVGKTDADINPSAEEAERFRQDDLEVMDSLQEKLVPEEAVSDGAGNVRWLQTVKRPLIDRDGVARQVLGVCTDITARKSAEAERERLQEEIIEAQKQALQELSTPIIPLIDRIIVMPLVGSIDSMRARDITRRLLAGIREQRAQVVILDITGVPIVDSGVADHLNKTIQAARLKGARTIVTGISDAVAETIVDLGIDWSGVETLSDLQTGLVVALDSLGIKLIK